MQRRIFGRDRDPGVALYGVVCQAVEAPPATPPLTPQTDVGGDGRASSPSSGEEALLDGALPLPEGRRK